MNTIGRFIKDDSGATAVEYGLMALSAGLAVSAIMPLIRDI